jgi:hypothetical protein
MKLKNCGWETKLRDGIIFWLILFSNFLVLINDFWDYLLDFLTPLRIGFRLEGY